jgi:Transposase DDE domain
MSHQDQHANSVRRNSGNLLQVVQWLFRNVDWSRIRLRDDCSWTPRWLAAAALFWAWSDESTLKERFFCAQRLTIHLQAGDAKVATSYQAFLKRLCRWTSEFVHVLQEVFRQRMIKEFPDHWTLHGYAVFGVDGSRVELPRTRSHEQAYAPAKTRRKTKGKRRHSKRDVAADNKARVPQIWLTTMFHVGLHLPWDWRIGPCDSSERAHALAMLENLPEHCLLTGDAGFVGYDFTRTVLESGRELLVRVGANVKLLKQLGYVRESAGTVYLWPDKASRKQQLPLVLRMIVVQGPKHPLYLIVSVREHHKLTNRQVAQLYRARWGVEVYYRHLKQTFGRRKLRSASAANARVELEWSIVGLWGMGLLATAELNRRGISLRRLSMAAVLKAFRRTARDYLHPSDHRTTLRRQMGHALIDCYQRQNKASRNYPRKKQERPAGKPVIQYATKTQTNLAKRLKIKKG